MVIRAPGRQTRKCLFRLYDTCSVWELVGKQIEDEEGVKWGSERFVKVYCAMCMKAAYAKAHLERAQSIKVVNTL